MTRKQMKRCSTSLAIRGMQIKTTIQSHYMPTRMAKMKTRRAPNSGEHADKPAHLHTARGNGVWHSPLEDSWAVSYKTKQATIVSLGSYTPGHTPQRNENEC